MTKKDYILIANALKPFYQDKATDKPWQEWDETEDTVRAMITAISKALSQDNPKFNPVRFLDMIRGENKAIKIEPGYKDYAIRLSLDWTNNYLTLDKFCRDYGLTEHEAKKIIHNGKQYLENRQ